MNVQDWTCPGTDDHGFVSLESLQGKAAQMSREEFLQSYPILALLSVFHGRDPSSSRETLDPNDQGVQLLTVSVKSTAILRYLGKVAFVAKRPGNPFAHLISVGRSTQNDITIAVNSVSKVHGYFAVEGNGWGFTDHGSTNGSKIDEEELEAGRKYPLRDGQLLQLGLEVMLEVMSPENLYRRLRG